MIVRVVNGFMGLFVIWLVLVDDCFWGVFEFLLIGWDDLGVVGDDLLGDEILGEFLVDKLLLGEVLFEELYEGVLFEEVLFGIELLLGLLLLEGDVLLLELLGFELFGEELFGEVMLDGEEVVGFDGRIVINMVVVFCIMYVGLWGYLEGFLEVVGVLLLFGFG